MPEPEPDRANDAEELRRRAEQAAAERMRDRELPPPERLPELVHELQVHQIELQMQNERLREAQAELEHSRGRYADLYDFAPVGYVTLDQRGIIREINLNACCLLGRERSHLLGRRLASYVADREKNRLADHLRRCRETPPGEEVTVEVTLRPHQGRELPVLLRTVPVADPHTGEQDYRLVIADVTELKRAEERLRELNETLEQQVAERTSALEMLRDIASMANRAQDVEDALEYCLRRVAEHNGWSLGHAYLPAADDPDLLLPAYAWYAAAPERFQGFGELTLKTPLRRGHGLPGSVFDSGKPEWSTDVRSDLGARRGDLAEDLGIIAGAAFPVMAENRVVGVLEFFSEKPIEPEAAILESMASVGLQLGRVIERKAFQDRLLTLAEEEHRRIGQELHDDVGQELTGLALKSETLAEMLGDEEGPVSKLARDTIAAVDRTRRKIQDLSRGLVPTEVEAPALEAALEGLARQTDEGEGISCRFRCGGKMRVGESRTATQLYRIAQEAVANVLRHSRAKHVEIALSSDEMATALKISDDGQGLPPAEKRERGMGLQIMRYRAGLIGGKLTVESPPTGGTRVVCRLPRNSL